MYENIVQLKLKSTKDGKKYLTDTLDTEGIFRLIESIPSKKAEPFKLWLAKLGGHAAKVARNNIEKNLGKKVIPSDNNLNYKYIDNKKTNI